MDHEPAREPSRIASLGLALAVAVAWAAAAHATSGPLPAAAADRPSADVPPARTAAWPWQRRGRTRFGAAPRRAAVPDTPHPAVARIIVPEEGATAYGSGTLVDVREKFGLVITNWHVVRDSQGTVEVVFPSGFRSQARPLKVDSDWDLAALVIWRPSIEPVPMAAVPPEPGDVLTIHGYGQGQYRIATGRCTQFYAPRIDFPTEMVELDVEARQGDSGGPIFNQHGELAGVLFGAGEGTTLGSYAPRVETFLATLAPDIGDGPEPAHIAVADRPAPQVPAQFASAGDAVTARNAAGDSWPSSKWTASSATSTRSAGDRPPAAESRESRSGAPAAEDAAPISWSDVASSDWYHGLKTLLALIGLAAVALQLVRLVK